MSKIRQKFNSLIKIALDTIFPPKCLMCDAKVDEANLLCPKCWKSITFISNPRCARCGDPFPYNFDNETICHYCIEDKPNFDSAISVIRFDEHSEKLIHNFKYYGKTLGCRNIAKMMVDTYGNKIGKIDIVCPIPMHPSKLKNRKYNQSSFLAKAICQIIQNKYVTDLLIKHKTSISQSGLNKEQRKQNVKNTYKINNNHKSLILRKNILLIDDVLTTGSTASECAKILKRYGARRVNVLTFAKTY